MTIKLLNLIQLIKKQSFIQISSFSVAFLLALVSLSFTTNIFASEKRSMTYLVKDFALESNQTFAFANLGGRTYLSTNQPLTGVLITAVNAASGEKHSVITDTQGFYNLTQLATGTNYIIEATFAGYRFSPISRVINHTAERNNVHFLGRLLRVSRSTPNDFDGDGQPDLTVFRPAEGNWYIKQSESGSLRVDNWGLANDEFVTGDYDGDLVADVAIFRNGEWFVRQSSQNNAMRLEHFGLAGDIPVPGDYDADGRDDFAVFRNGIWYIKSSAAHGTFRAVQFGLAGDKTVSADYDGDGATDIAVYRDGVWYWLQSSDNAFRVVQFGIASDIPVVGDYDGDRISDQAVYRDGVWYLLRSRDGFVVTQFGLPTDILIPADYDGDGKTDLAIYRPSTSTWWYSASASGGQHRATQFGISTDKPVPNAFVR